MSHWKIFIKNGFDIAISENSSYALNSKVAIHMHILQCF